MTCGLTGAHFQGNAPKNSKMCLYPHSSLSEHSTGNESYSFVLHLLNKVWCHGVSYRSILRSMTTWRTSLFRKWIYPHAGIIKDSQTTDWPLLGFLLKLCSHFLRGHIVRSNLSLSERWTGWTTSEPCRCDYDNFLTRPKAKHVVEQVERTALWFI